MLGARYRKRLLLLCLLSLTGAPCRADTEGRTRYDEVVPRKHELSETVRYVGYLYFLTLGGWLVISHNEVFNNATLQNYFRNFGSITLFDQDLPTANWGMHLATGAIAYQIFRSRSYTKTDSFFLTLIQESLFQFTVETLIQPTALENVGNTAIVGTALGRGLEVASLPMLNSDIWIVRLFGHVLNLPTIFGLYENTTIVPVVESGAAGLELQVRF